MNLELALADLETVNNRISKVERRALTTKEREAIREFEMLKKLKKALEEGKKVRNIDILEEEKEILRNYQLLTSKPVIYVANVAEDDVINLDDCHYYQKVKKFAENENNEVVAITAQIEEEISALDQQSRQMFLDDLGIKNSGLDEIILKTYSLLNLCTFFTVGDDEVRAWTFTKGMKAPDCAGLIHTDFKKGFIRAEVYKFDDLIVYGSELALKEAGKIRVEGKDYACQDGDVMFVRFNV